MQQQTQGQKVKILREEAELAGTILQVVKKATPKEMGVECPLPKWLFTE